ncbi:titin, partial [Trichonephila clavata]
TKDEIRVREGLCSVIRTDDSGKSELILKEIDSDDDDSVVQCSVQNPFGKMTSEAAIRILSLPKLGYPSSYKEGLTFDSGDTLRLRVTIFGKPPPTISWFFNDSEPPLNERMSVVQLPDSIEIHTQNLSAEDSGHYKIVAYNVMGEDSIDIEVIITGPPDPPDGPLIFEVVEDNEVILKWNPPLRDGGSEIYSYIVEIKKVKEIWSRFGSTHKTSMSIGDIDDIEGSAYRIRATNIYGTSESSTEISFRKANLNSGLELIPCEPIELSKCSEQRKASEFEIPNDNFSLQTTESIKPEIVTTSKEIESQKCEKELLIDIADEKCYVDEVNPMLPDLVLPFTVCLSRRCLEFSNEVSNFACERFLQACPSVPVLECEKFCVMCLTATLLESINYLSQNEVPTVECFYSWTPCECFVEICETFCYVPFSYWTDTLDFVPQYISQSEEKNIFWTIGVPQEEKHSINFDEPSYVSISPETIQKAKWAIFVFWPPFLLEHVESYEIRIPQRYYCHTSFCCLESLLISLSSPFETSRDLTFPDALTSCDNVVFRTDSSEDFEGLISMCSVPIRTWKPAMSVLPIRRHIQVDGLQNSVLPKDPYSSAVNSQRKLWENSSENEKVFENVYELDSELKSQHNLELLSELDDEPLLNIKSEPKSILNTKSLTKPENKIPAENNATYPSWLCRVSPYFVSNSETTGQEKNTDLDFEDEEEIEEVKPAKAYFCEYDIKQKSVQELLQLAEEVERSFSQKAEQIESLECILQEELFSLEKDLKVVSEIHKSSHDLVDTYLHDHLSEDCLLDISAPMEKNLIEFSEDVPSTSPGNGKSSEYPPEVVVHLQNRIVQTGCRTRLYCSIMGDPNPEIKWMKNGKTLPLSSRYLFSNLIEFGLYMDIFNAKSTDSGQYTCIATNCHGSTQTQAYLQVVGEREVSPEEPKFLKSPDDLSCHMGESVVMEWKTSGTPTPHVMWFKNAERIETDLRTDTFSNHRGCCRLALHDVNINDSAIYTCYLENEAGSAVSTVLLTVTGIEDPSDCQESYENRLITNERICTFKNQLGDLQTSSTHKKYSGPVSEDESSCDPETWSTFGEKHFRKKKNNNPPGSPIAPHILSSGQTWTILTWSSPMEGRGRFEYLVERRLINTDRWTEAGRTFNTLYTVHGLMKGRTYVFRISAGNSRGWSLPSILPQPIHAPTR